MSFVWTVRQFGTVSAG